MSEELSLEQLYDRYTTEEQYKEANASPTVLTGGYRFKVQSLKTAVFTEEDAAKYPNDKKIIPGRQHARIFAGLYDRATGARKGSIGFTVSWIENRIKGDDGLERLDGAAKLWGQLLKATDTMGKPVGEILKDILPNVQFDGFVEEAFKMPDGEFKKYRGETEDDRKANRKVLAEAGGDPINYVNSLFKPRA